MSPNYRRTKLACYTSYFTMASIFSLPPLLFVTFREMYGISYTLLGTLVLTNFCTQLIVDLIFTVFAKRFNVHKIVKIMPLMTTAGLMIYAAIPTLFPSIAYTGLLFGPAVGGIVGVATDLVSYFLSSQIYPPNLIVTFGAMSIGLISGFIAKFVIKKRGYAQIIVSASCAHLIGSVVIKSIGLFTFYGWAIMWRIPLYFVVAPIEIMLLCMLYKNKAFRRLIDERRI